MKNKTETGNKKSGASFNRGKSNQAVGTPRDFIMAVQKKFGRISWDLAATRENSVVEGNFEGNFLSPEIDSLKSEWPSDKLVHWLNPPFSDISPWAKKCSEENQRCGWTLLLVPASISTNWWGNYVHMRSMVYAISPRIKFAGSDNPYPKDLSLCAYGYGACGYTQWKWS